MHINDKVTFKTLDTHKTMCNENTSAKHVYPVSLLKHNDLY